MYHPYFRGKQYELITVREKALFLKQAGFTPIIEPVKESLAGLDRALGEVIVAGGKAVLVINPVYGDSSTADIQSFFETRLSTTTGIAVGILIGANANLSTLRAICEKNSKREICLIHSGHTDGDVVAKTFGSFANVTEHVFFEDVCGKLYRRHFLGAKRILLRDGFQRRANREHPDLEFFSDLHVTFREEGMDGFGDFLVVGDDFQEGGGPAYAVAIHVTFVDSSKDNAMFIRHFKSDRTSTPTDPAGKFAEALQKLVAEVERAGSRILRTPAIKEFIELHQRRHFPGLGYVKKLSMQHHIETLGEFLKTP